MVMKKKITVSMRAKMVDALDAERKSRKLKTIPETIRSILGDYFKEQYPEDGIQWL